MSLLVLLFRVGVRPPEVVLVRVGRQLVLLLNHGRPERVRVVVRLVCAILLMALVAKLPPLVLADVVARRARRPRLVVQVVALVEETDAKQLMFGKMLLLLKVSRLLRKWLLLDLARRSGCLVGAESGYRRCRWLAADSALAAAAERHQRPLGFPRPLKLEGCVWVQRQQLAGLLPVLLELPVHGLQGGRHGRLAALEQLLVVAGRAHRWPIEGVAIVLVVGLLLLLLHHLHHVQTLLLLLVQGARRVVDVRRTRAIASQLLVQVLGGLRGTGRVGGPVMVVGELLVVRGELAVLCRLMLLGCLGDQKQRLAAWRHLERIGALRGLAAHGRLLVLMSGAHLLPVEPGAAGRAPQSSAGRAIGRAPEAETKTSG